VVIFFSLAAVNTILKKYFSSQYCVKTNVKVLQSRLLDIKDLTFEEKKERKSKDPSSMQQRLKNLETSFSPRMKIKTPASLEKLYKTGKTIGKGGDLCGFYNRTNSFNIHQASPPQK